jgi:hypothetical protein
MLDDIDTLAVYGKFNLAAAEDAQPRVSAVHIQAADLDIVIPQFTRKVNYCRPGERPDNAEKCFHECPPGCLPI